MLYAKYKGPNTRHLGADTSQIGYGIDWLVPDRIRISRLLCVSILVFKSSITRQVLVHTWLCSKGTLEFMIYGGSHLPFSGCCLLVVLKCCHGIYAGFEMTRCTCLELNAALSVTLHLAGVRSDAWSLSAQPQHQQYYHSLASAGPLIYFSLLTVGCLTPETFTPRNPLEPLGLRGDKPSDSAAMLVASTRDWQVYRAALSAWAAAMRLWSKEVVSMGGSVSWAPAAAGEDGGGTGASAIITLFVAPQMRPVQSIIEDMRE